MEGKAPPNMINQLEIYYCLALNFNYNEHRQNLVFFLSVFEGSNFDFITRGFLLSNLRDITSISFLLGRSTRNIPETSDIDAKNTVSHRRPQGEATLGQFLPPP